MTAKEDHGTAALVGHLGDQRIVGVQHGRALGRYAPDGHGFDQRQLFHGVDAGHAQVIAFADVRNDGDVTPIEAQAFAQQAAARGFEHGSIDTRITEHRAGALGTTAVAGVEAAVFDVNPVRAGHSHAAPGHLQQVRHAAGGGGLAVGTGHGDDRNAAVFAVRENRIDHRLTDRAGRALRRLDMHAQPRGRVDFDDGSAGDIERLVDARGDNVDAGHVQADHGRRVDSALGDQRMNLVGDVDRAATGAEVGVAPEDDDLARFGNGFNGEALLGQHFEADGIEPQFAERGCVIFAAARIEVFDVDELGDGVRSVADDGRRLPARRRDQAATNDQQPEIAAFDLALDHDLAVLGDRDLVGGHDRVARGKANRNAAALIAFARLYNHRHADFLRRGPGFFGAVDTATLGHRHADGAEQ